MHSPLKEAEAVIPILPERGVFPARRGHRGRFQCCVCVVAAPVCAGSTSSTCRHLANWLKFFFHLENWVVIYFK